MSFKKLIQTVSPTLRGITHKLNGHFTFFDEDDLFQEALVYLWAAYHEGKLADKTNSYILQGCYFYLRNHIRKIQDKANLTSLEMLLEKEGSDLEDNACFKEAPSPVDNISNKISIEQIRNSLLTKREKEILALYLEGLTVREIGRKLGISHVMVVKTKNRIIAKSKNPEGVI